MDQFFYLTKDYAQKLWMEITHPHWSSFFYTLIAVSLFFWLLEIKFPWRKEQGKFRRDFWLDAFYMFFNAFIFPLVGFYALSKLFDGWWHKLLSGIGLSSMELIHIQYLPIFIQVLIIFLLRDFVHWWTHRLLHRIPFLWQFHKVHHSVREMGFAAHLRYHWSENVVYRLAEYLPLSMIGADFTGYAIVHLFTLSIGHFNHSNLKCPLGPFKYILNNPQMHIWHHAKVWPAPFRYGINFGLTLSVWDYLFKTASIPSDGRDIELGFENLEEFPEDFVGQQLYPMVTFQKGVEGRDQP